MVAELILSTVKRVVKYEHREFEMKYLDRWTFIYAFLTLIIGCMWLLPGCQPDKPKPKPEPSAGLSIVVIYDSNDASDTASYADPVLDKYAASKGHALRTHPINVVDESKQTPKYLKPYIDAAQGKKLPIVFLGQGGKIKGSLERPANVQATIAYLDKTLGEVVPEDSFWAGGEWRKLSKPSLMAQKPGAENRWTVEGSDANEPLIPRDKWVEVDLSPFVWKVKNQGQLSSCCPTSGCSVIEISSARAGLNKFTLSVADAYQRINGGRDAGANLEDFTSIVTAAGVCTTDFCKEQAVRATDLPGYDVSRAKHRVLKATFCPDFDAIASAIQRHKPVHFGLLVDSGFSPNDKGIIGPKKSHGGGGHAVVACGMKKVNGEWYLVMLNSWGAWGGSKDGSIISGCCLLHPSYIESMFGAFAYSAVVSPSDDPIQ